MHQNVKPLGPSVCESELGAVESNVDIVGDVE